jgi:hypothetical protein
MSKNPVLGKREIVQALIDEGFTADESSRSYEIILDTIENGLRNNRTIYFRRLFKVWTAKLPPRKYWDNWNKRHVYFGERTVLKVKPFLLKDRNFPLIRKLRDKKLVSLLQVETV